MRTKIEFFKEAVKTYKTSGTLIPSSRFLAARMLKTINFKSAHVIVELGPGNGAITRHILKNLHPNARLICFEINENFHEELQRISHPQLTVLKSSAEHICEELDKLMISKACHIISSLPLSIIPNEITKAILENSFKALESNGDFIQYQYSLSYFKKLKAVFHADISLEFEPLNFPPAFVYRCKKLA